MILLSIHPVTITVQAIGRIPPPPHKRKIEGFRNFVLADTWYKYECILVTIYTEWRSIAAGTLQCGASHEIKISTETGISKRAEEELISTIGAKLNIFNLAELGSTISRKVGVSITLSKKVTVTRTWKISSPPGGECDYALYQRYVVIVFEYLYGGIFGTRRWTYTVDYGMPIFHLAVSKVEKIHLEVMKERKPSMDMFIRTRFKYTVKGTFENGTSTKIEELLTVISPANITRDGMIYPLGWKRAYEGFGEVVRAPHDVPTYIASFMKNAKARGILEYAWGTPHILEEYDGHLKVWLADDVGFSPIVIVVDGNNVPIEGAVVETAFAKASTNEFGIAVLKGINLTEVQDVEIVVTKEGYEKVVLTARLHPRVGILMRYIAEYEKLMAEYNSLLANYTMLQDELLHFVDKYRSLEQNYTSLATSCGKLREEYNALRLDYEESLDEIKSLKQEVADLTEKYEETKRELEDTQATLASRTNTIYLLIFMLASLTVSLLLMALKMTGKLTFGGKS
ncbi:MAG: hypothetical protein DRN15_08255 [Thermoprotei archaeon]|nr:MAG: hypothetical protein DRM97_05665 [Thermoprotei archaeon]RLF22749.1 MAG: hypothetical protein DRN15_08255 [Thermoprotei archaeon]